MNPNVLKTDPEFQSKIPPLTFEELNQLEANILRDGRILNPIIVWEGLIVDGHNRYTIAKKHPEIPFTIHEKEFASRYEAIIWICKNQLGRRNLTPEQNGISKNTVLRAEQFSKGVDAAEEAVPGTRKKVLSGEVKPTASEIASVARAPPEDRAALVAAICKAKEPLSQKQKSPPATTTPLSDAGTSDEDATSAPTPSEPTFPPKAGESLKADRQQILEIANGRYHAKQLADGAAMLCEVSGAVNSMIRRWESVFRDYPDLLTDAGNRAVVKRTIQKVKDYLQRLEDTI